MAHTFTRKHSAPFSARSEIPFVGIFARVSAWNAARRTRNALSQLSAHELEDIGLLRGDIDRITDRQF